MSIKIASWNVNSLRVRLTQVLAWLKEHQPDVLALQETKLTDDIFPESSFHEIGYQVIYAGQKTYNGMATISKLPLTNIQKNIPLLNQAEQRVLGASLGKIRIWNVYVPNGESITSEKYQYKLSWLNHFRNFITTELKTYPQLIILGDFNIAPEACDVYDPAHWEGQVLFSELERARLRQLFELGLKDCFRLHHATEKSYTWWDYRLNAFKRNMGLRIDHILASLLLAKQCLYCSIDKNPRASERPSDHAPIIAEFKEN